MGLTVNSDTSTVNSSFGCGSGGHVRLWGGGLDAMPKVCQCGAVRYESHACPSCGVIHEHGIANTPIERDWNTPEEDAAWRDL